MQDLARTELLAGLDRQQIGQLLDGLWSCRLDKSEHLYRQGEAAHAFYLLRRGQVKLYRISPDGQEKVMDLIRPGEVFAETVMFSDESPVHATHADALEASELYAIEQRVFKAVLQQSPEACFRVMAVMSRRLQRQLNEIDHLALHDATHRLVCFLLEQSPDSRGPEPCVRFKAPKHVIASRLSIKPETLSRMLQRLERDGLIAVRGQTVLLHDITALYDMVGLAPTPRRRVPARPVFGALCLQAV